MWFSVLFFFFLHSKNHAVRAGLWVLLVAAVTLPSQLNYPHHPMYCIVNIKQFMDFPDLNFMLAWVFGFWMWRLTRAGASCSNCLHTALLQCAWPRREPQWPDRGIVSVWHSVVLWDFGLRYESRVGVAGSRIWSPCLAAGAGCLGPGGLRNTSEMDMEHFDNPCLSVAVAKCWFLGLVVRERTYVCSVFTATLT